MAKLLSVLVACTFLAGCVAHETDLQAAQEDRDAQLMQKRAESGCSFLHDHDAYRECLLNTYYSQHPQNYTTETLNDGEPLAIISTKSHGCKGSACNDQLRGMPAAGPQIVPYIATESTTVETNCTHDYEQQEAVISTEEIIPVAVEAPKSVNPPVVTEQPVIPTKPVVAKSEASWWENYQDKKPTDAVLVAPKCPCDDPNDPCPQCYDK